MIEYNINTEINTTNCCALIVRLSLILFNIIFSLVCDAYGFFCIDHFFQSCFSFHLTLVFVLTCFFFVILVLLFCHTHRETNLFFAFVFRTFFKRSTQFVVRLYVRSVCLFVYLLLLGFIRYSNNNFAFVLSLLFSQNYYFIMVLYYLCVYRHTFTEHTIP